MVEVVTIDSPPPPKKRRTVARDVDTAPLDGIAQTNATLAHMLGGRQNRWMQGFPQNHAANDESQTRSPTTTTTNARTQSASRAPPNGNHAAASQRPGTHSSTPPPPPGNNVNARATGANLATSSAAASHLPPSASTAQKEQERPEAPVTQQPRESSGPSSGLVQYETPVGEDSMFTFPQTTAAYGTASAININGRKSVDITRAGPQPGLPSPAPSDENSNSPTFATSNLNQARNRQSLHQLRIPSEGAAMAAAAARPVSASHVSQHALQAMLLQQQQHHQAHLRRQSQHMPTQLPQAPPYGHPAFPPGPMSPGLPQQHQNQPPQGPHGRQLPNNGQIMQFPQPAPVPSNAQPMSPLGPPNSFPPTALQASRVDRNVLLQRLAKVEGDLKRTVGLASMDQGRIQLMREAVQKGDWFYQVTSQLFCLYHIKASALPRSMRNLEPRCYAFLSNLLCDNAMVKPTLVQFFADFPEPIIDIYSDGDDGARKVYEARVATVKEFFNRLPLNWDNMIKQCREGYFAPPLVQDIVDALNIKGIVLQTVVFRAIARMIYGSGPVHAKGISAVEKVHEIDQATYCQSVFRRTPAEKQQAYIMLRQVYEQWQIVLRHHQGQQSANIEFSVPPGILDYFRTPTQNLLQNQQPHIGHQQQQQQHQGPIAHSPTAMPNHQVLQQRLQQAQLQPGRASPNAAQMLQQQQQFQGPVQHGFPVGPTGMLPPGQTAQQLGPRRFFPRKTDPAPPQPTHPDSNRAALHQAHLRSPRLKAAPDPASRLYRHVIGFGIPPTPLKTDVPSQAISLDIPAQMMAKVAKTLPSLFDGEPRRRYVEEGSIMYRLRCSAIPPGGFTSESAWVTTDNYWPEDLKFKFNDTVLEGRRKLQHGRYQPIDLTAFVHEGENTLTVSRNGVVKNRKQTFAVAVEIIGTIRQDSIEANIQRISAEQSLESIKKSLGGGGSDDDDIAVTSSTLTVKLFDPYSGCKMFDTPVRGSACLHKDCFDLLTFLEFCKRQETNWPTVVDCWRCPICRGDVRPQTLVLDEFLVSVRKRLAELGQLDTRAIIVEADGAWMPKGEEKDGVRSPSLEREMQHQRMQGLQSHGARFTASRSASAATLPRPRVPEIIELD